MFKKLRAALIASFALAIASSVTAMAANPIYTGGVRGSYFGSFGPLLLDLLDSEFFDYELQTSSGSGENIDRVLENPLAIGMVQSDVLAFRSTLNSEVANQVTVIRADIAHECLYAVTLEVNLGRLANWGDVVAYSHRLRFVSGPENSGSAQTFRFLQTIEGRLANVREMNHLESTDAAIQAVIDGTADIAFFVQFPDTSNPRFERINEERLAFVPVVDRAMLRQTLPNGDRTYVPLDVKVTSADLLSWRGVNRILTACTPLSYISGRPESLPGGSSESLDLREMIQVVQTAPIESLQPSESWFQAIVDDVAESSSSVIEGTLSEVDRSLEQVIE